MVEQEIELEIFSSNFEWNLTSDERETDAEFDEELTEMREKSMLEVALLGLFRESQEIEVVGVFDELLSEIGLRQRERRLKIGDRFSLPPEKTALNLHHQDVAAPAILDSLLNVPGAFDCALHFVEQNAIVEPWQLCSSLLHN